jgi:hypothetical protein
MFAFCKIKTLKDVEGQLQTAKDLGVSSKKGGNQRKERKKERKRKERGRGGNS